MILSEAVLSEFNNLGQKTQNTLLSLMNSFNSKGIREDFVIHFYGKKSISEVSQKGICGGSDLIDRNDPLLYVYSNNDCFISKNNNPINFISISRFIKANNINL